MWLVADVRDLDHAEHMLTGAIPVDTFDSMIFKKKVTELCTYYGMYEGDKLVAYFWFLNIRTHANALKGYEFHVVEEMRRRGIGLFFYEYIVLSDQKIIVTDYSHTESSSKLWIKLQTLPEFKVGMYDAIADAFDWETPATADLVYGNDNVHFAVRATTIQDIDVDEAHKVTSRIVINTANAAIANSRVKNPDAVIVLSKPLSFEL